MRILTEHALARILLSIAVGGVACGLAKAQSARSIRQWVTGDGRTDDSVGVAKAFEACKNHAFTLQVDCPVFIHIGTDIARSIFIDNGTDVQFSGNGKFIVDNQFIPAFVLANSSDVHLNNWDVEYRGGLPISPDVGGYYKAGAFVAGNTRPSVAFNDMVLTPWLESHRGITFNRRGGPDHTTSIWQGPSNMAAEFYFIGPTNHVSIANMKMSAPSSAGGHQFIPMAFSFGHGYNSNQTATPLPGGNNDNWVEVPNIGVPNNLSFSDVTLDGYYMGFQGVLQGASFAGITGLRYGDLQDSSGATVGGQGKWFAPPHLFYLKYQSAKHPFDSRLSARDLQISDVKDLGPRIGTARDTSSVNGSGCANSLKIGAINSTVTNYVSQRPDGLADILASDNLTLSDITATYDSSFVNDLYPGIRFPADDYKDVKLNNVTLTDVSNDPYSHATSKIDGVPIGGRPQARGSGVSFNNVRVNLKRWTQGTDLQPRFGGSNNNTHITVNIQH